MTVEKFQQPSQLRIVAIDLEIKVTQNGRAVIPQLLTLEAAEWNVKTIGRPQPGFSTAAGDQNASLPTS